MRTAAEIWRQAAERKGGDAYLVQGSAGWTSVTWAGASAAVDALAAGFLSLGIGHGDRVAILSRTRLEWSLCDWALLSLGAIVVPIYPTSSPNDVELILADSGARAVVCEDGAQVGRVEMAQEPLKDLEWTVVIEDSENTSARALSELDRDGRAYNRADPDALRRARQDVSENDLATIIYTSGTTGDPKGCVLTHQNLHAMVECIEQVPNLVRSDDLIVLFLPLAHAFGRVCAFAGARIGGTIAFCPDVARVAQAVESVRPTLLPTVPRLLEKVHSATMSKLESAEGLQGRLGRWALRVGEQASAMRREQGTVPWRLRPSLWVADRLVFSKVKLRLGGRLRLAISGGAALPLRVGEFFDALGLDLVEGYGLTECSAVASVGHPGRHRLGTVGPALPGTELSVDADGEILTRSEAVFAGYWRDEQATAEVLTADGWLRTGDLGELDDAGSLTITDRKKDVIVTAAGKNVSPARVESLLKSSPYVSEALVIGDSRPFVVALITMDGEELQKAGTDDDQVEEVVGELVERVNRQLGDFERVRRHAILPREFSAERGEITPTLKLRRRVCEEHFADEIERLYGGRV